MRTPILFSLILLSFSFGTWAKSNMADCRGTLWQNQASVKREILFSGKAISLWDKNSRYEQQYYDITSYKLNSNGNLLGIRTGSSNFNEFRYTVEISPVAVKVEELSIPHYNKKEIRHFAECVLRVPMSSAEFEQLKRSLL